MSNYTEKVILAAIEVHRNLGPGLLESAYAACMWRELDLMGVRFDKERPLPVWYKGMQLDCGYRIDLVVEDSLIVELKCVDKILPVHKSQLLTYLKLSKINTGLILNFNCELLRDGIKRMVL